MYLEEGLGEEGRETSESCLTQYYYYIVTVKHVFLSGGNLATSSQFSQDSHLTEKERTEVKPLTRACCFEDTNSIQPLCFVQLTNNSVGYCVPVGSQESFQAGGANKIQVFNKIFQSPFSNMNMLDHVSCFAWHLHLHC